MVQFPNGHLTIEYGFADGIMIRPSFVESPVIGIANANFQRMYCVWEMVKTSETTYTISAAMRGFPEAEDTCAAVTLSADTILGQDVVQMINRSE